MLAQTTTPTWVAIAGLAVLLIPVLIASLRGAQAYGRLEQKVDNLALMQAAADEHHQEAVRLIASTMDKLADKFNEHAIQDAGHFGELRGMVSTHFQPVPQSPVPQSKG